MSRTLLIKRSACQRPAVHDLRRALLGFVLLAALILSACGPSATTGDDPIESAGVLRVGTEGVYAPFSYHDPATGLLTGYDVDVARAVGEKLGVTVEFVETPWDSIFAALEADRFDVVANQVTITPERQHLYDLSEPYAIGEGVIVTRADDDSITSLDDLRGRTAAQSTTSNWAQVARDAGARIEAVVTHEIQFARQVSDQVLFTDHGVILEQGPPAAVIGDPKEERTRQFLERILNPL